MIAMARTGSGVPKCLPKQNLARRLSPRNLIHGACGRQADAPLSPFGSASCGIVRQIFRPGVQEVLRLLRVARGFKRGSAKGP